MNDIEKRARELIKAECPDLRDEAFEYGSIMTVINLHAVMRALRAALTPPEGSDQSLLELAATFETCIPFLPSAGQRNIGKAVAQLRHMAMGYVLVPVEPTEAMIRAYREVDGRFESARADWAAMLAARPEVSP